MRKTGVTLNDSVIALFKSILENENIEYTYRAVDRTLSIGESLVLFRCIDDPERIKSIANITDVWLEEATEFTPDDFTQLVLRLRTPGIEMQFILSFNPVSKLNWVYRFFFNQDDPEYFLEGRDYIIHESTYKDNSFLPSSYISDLLSLQKSNPIYYNIYAEGEWGTLGKLVFPVGTYKIKKLQIPLGVKHIYGCDPGVTDKFAITCAAILPDNTLYVYKELCESNILCKTVAEWTRTNIPSNATIFTDNAGKAQIQELNALGAYQFKSNEKPPGSVLATIDKLKTYNIVISPDCINLCKDFTMYSYEKDKKTGLYLNEPARETDGYHCDVIDALRYSLQGVQAGVKKINKPLPMGL